MISTLNATLGAKELRPFWKVRLVAIGLTVALSFMIAGGAILIMFGDKSSLLLTRALGFGRTFALISRIAQYALGLAGLVIGIDLIRHFGPAGRSRWRWVTVGTAFTVAAFIIVSFMLSLYLRFAPSYSATYGSLGAVVVLMLWLYLMGLMILVGSEIDRVIETDQERANHGLNELSR